MKTISTVEERFWSRINKDGPIPPHCPELGACWVWTAGQNGHGYGTLRIGTGKHKASHRLGYELQVGPIPDGVLICHRCDNPLCVRGSHLFPGTPAENTADCQEKGRIARGDRNGSRLHPESITRGAKIPWAKLSDTSVREIRVAYQAGGLSQRQIAAQYGVSKTTIGLAINGYTWGHVE